MQNSRFMLLLLLFLRRKLTPAALTFLSLVLIIFLLIMDSNDFKFIISFNFQEKKILIGNYYQWTGNRRVHS